MRSLGKKRNKTKDSTTVDQQSTTEPDLLEASRVLRDPKANKKGPLKIALIIIFAVLIGLVAYKLLKDKQGADKPSDVIFSIDDRDFKKDEVYSYLDIAVNVYGLDRAKAQEGLITAMKYKIAAEKYNVEISDKQIREALNVTTYAKIAKQSAALDKWVNAIGLKLAIEDHITNQQYQGKQGYSFVFYFGNLIVPSADPEDDFADFGDKKLIKRDKDYALKRAEYYHKQLEEGKLTLKQALEQVQADEQLNYGYFPKSSYSINFGNGKDQNSTWQSQVFLADIIKFIEQSVDVNKTSEVMTGKQDINLSPKKDPDYRETYYYFTHVTNSNNQAANVQKQIDNMKVTINKP